MARDRTYPDLPDRLPAPIADGHTHIEPAQHLAQTPLDLAEQIRRAGAVGVTRIVQCGCDLAAARWTATEAVKEPAVIGAIALHPNEAARLEPRGLYADALAEIATLARKTERIRAIGETGLDYYRTPDPAGQAIQRAAFRDHIALAKELDRALQIHDRDAHDDVLATLAADGAPERTVFHCFSGDRAMAEFVTERGWYISLAGTLTFAGNDALRQAAAAVPLDRILVETDAPYLTPQPYRGRPNAPYLAVLTARALAESRQLDLVDCCEALYANAQRVYGSW